MLLEKISLEVMQHLPIFIYLLLVGGLLSQPLIRYYLLWDRQGSTYVPLARICLIPHRGEMPPTLTF